MGSNTKRLIQTDATPQKTMRLSTCLSLASSKCEQQHVSSNRANSWQKMGDRINDKNRWGTGESPIGTIADHRMTNNNRIRSEWHMLAVILPLLLVIAHVTVVNGYPEPTPVRVSHSYTKTVSVSSNKSSSSPSQTTFRSTTKTTPFLASDAIVLPTFSSPLEVSKITNNIVNANTFDTRAESGARASRKEFTTSIDRPYYTKITHDDAVPKPSYYNNRGKMPTKKQKKKKNSSKFSTSEKMSFSDEEDDYAFMPQTTEKAYHHPPKLSLEPFFNFLTSLATASREVISKERIQQQPETISNSSNNKYSPSYETINQSMREGAKKSKKGKKGKGKKGGKGRKGSKKDKGSSKRQRVKSEEEEDEELTSEGPIPIPLPNPIIDSVENEENDSPPVDTGSPGGLHILDVLRTPMIPDYESPPTRAEALIASEQKDPISANMNASSSFSSNPPSARANLNKGQGYLSFDNYDAVGTNTSSGAGANKQRDKQRGERDPIEAFQGHNLELQAQESIHHAQTFPNSYGLKSSVGVGGAPTSHQYQEQQHTSGDIPPASAQQPTTQTKSAEFTKPQTDIFGQALPQDDIVSKYPTTFVYRPSGQPLPPGSRPFMSQSPLGMPPNKMFGPPAPQASSRPPPFRMNKLRPNLHSYYDPNYHNYAGAGESVMGSDMFGIRHAFGPPHFRPHPHRSPFPQLASPPRYNGNGNRLGFMVPHHSHGSHYVGHTFSNPPSSSREPITKPYENNGGIITSPTGGSNDYQLDSTGSSNTNGNPFATQDIITGSSNVGPSSNDNIDHYSGAEIDENSLTTGSTAAENSENKKIGIMESFDLFYKEYKILTWVAVFFATSLALLSLLVYLYINNPPTEVVQARELFSWDNLLKNPQVVKFLSSIVETRFGQRSDYDPPTEYLKPYGQGFGGKSGRQKRKQTRSQQDKDKFARRRTKITRRNNSAPIATNSNDKNPLNK